MATVILNHRVKDYSVWRPHFDADTQRRNKAGFNGLKVFRAADDPNNIYIIGEIEDPALLDGFMKDPELAEKMQEAGVISEPRVHVLNPS